MIPLGSCTMKLNGTTEMMPITWSAFSDIHPFAPTDQAKGYHRIIADLEDWLAEITGFDGVSLQPNSGAQGEYAGLLVIRAWQRDRGEGHRNVCLIPSSAHGTNPASAVMAGMKVKVVRCDADGNIDLDDLRQKAEAHADELAALMVTYPSTHGVFEEHIREVCDVVHEHGGQVYLDGANLNAQVGLCRPADYGADVCHINLHKTFAIPHGGAVRAWVPSARPTHLTPFLPGHPVVKVGGDKAIGPVSAAPWGSASILIISWAYIALLGREGVRRATEVAILNANYMAKRLEGHFDVLFRGAKGRVAHEFILDLRPFRKTLGDQRGGRGEATHRLRLPRSHDVVAGSGNHHGRAHRERVPRGARPLLRRPRLHPRRDPADRDGIADREDNALRNAPHTAAAVVANDWDHAYSREQAAYPAAWTRESKFWPTVRRVDNAYGDRNLVCACPPIEEYA
jgi:glycine dehydrogenase